jgi:hypothetical protein
MRPSRNEAITMLPGCGPTRKAMLPPAETAKGSRLGSPVCRKGKASASAAPATRRGLPAFDLAKRNLPPGSEAMVLIHRFSAGFSWCPPSP